MTIEILGLILLLLFSGFFSSSELAFILSNKIKIEIRARKENLAARNVHYFVNNSSVFYSTILISNNIINIAFASLITIFLYQLYEFSDFLILLISSTLLLLFGELIPKYIAREYADGVIMISAIPIRLVTFLLYPLVKITSSISSVLTKGNELDENEIKKTLYDKEDLQILIEEGTEAGKVEEIESDVITNIIELGDQKVYEAMSPRTDIVGVPGTSAVEDVIKTFIDSGYSKIPVFGEDLDDIKGVVYAYDMFKNPDSIKSVQRDVIFVPETKKSLEMLNEFLDKRISVAIVVDEFGGTAGLITVEDIIEEMLGEIHDEYDVEDEVCKKVEENVFVISGKVEIDRIEEELEIEFKEGEYETIAGYITAGIGRIPLKGEEIILDNFKINVLHSDKTKIDLIKLHVTEVKEKDSD